MADVDYDDWAETAAPSRAGRLGNLVNLAGAAVSVLLVAGLALWGYKLAMRDVNGIPVVRALAGPARVAPQEPGGTLADHQGLSVNGVTAEGEAAPASGRVILAPQPVGLTDADMPVARSVNPDAAGTSALMPEDANLSQDLPAGAIDEAAERAMADAVAEQLAAEAAAGAVPRPMPRPARVTSASLSVDAAGDAITTAPAETSGDAEVDAAIAAAVASLAPEEAAAEVDAAAIPAGTRLVQLGAFDSIEEARAEWGRLAGIEILAPLISGKSRVIQEAESGGRGFFRLRAMGFDDVDQARAFCAAFVAENVSCIPVQLR